ncbi:vWA domain-containing protein [Paenisporosarcina sp. HGH0030]|uniref:vWA domain-containing protein n=1 Tax=Paenisporosarcina sp. HGH0030 TaxID=1078085 RepID=UPI001E4F49BA|nr:vWA domain-containing protein [Paenisporosarcina sp. HGH0030]
MTLNYNRTEIIFLLDRSGSMSGLESDTIGGFNAFIEKQCQLEGKVSLTTVLFDDQYEILWDGINAAGAKITHDDYYVRGTTAMLDAVGKTIVDVGHRLSKTPEELKPGKVIFVITTDGMENASCEFTHDKVKKLIKQQEDQYSWEFIFIGANMDAEKEAGSMGIQAENAFNFVASEIGVESMYEMVNENVSKRRKR